jgi:hypothetical protein
MTTTNDIMSERDADKKQTYRKAEGQHGEKTHEAFIEGLHGRHGGSEESEGRPQGPQSGAPIEGHHRLFEDRQQHDEAEKKSEATRLARELERSGQDAGDAPSTKGGKDKY